MKTIDEESGFGLVEIMVSMVLLALILLGMGSLHLSTIQTSIDRNNRRIALTLAQDKIEEFHSQAYNQLVTSADPANPDTPETITNAAELNNYTGYQRISAWDYVNEDNFDTISGSVTNAIKISVTVSSTSSSLINRFSPITLEATRTSWE